MATSGPILLLGGRSEIGLQLTVRLVQHGATTVVLAARRAADLDEQEQILRAAGASQVRRVEFDADNLLLHRELLTGLGPLGVVVVAFGILGNQELAERNVDEALAVVHTDYVAHVSILTHAAGVLRSQAHGELVVFSSVAGARVRRANYVYGSAKAGLDGFASGLSDALTGSGVHLLLVRPGFVIGRMTSGMRPAPFSSTPEQVADAAFRALQEGRDVVWVPPVLRWVVAVMRVLPRAVWRRLPR